MRIFPLALIAIGVIALLKHFGLIDPEFMTDVVGVAVIVVVIVLQIVLRKHSKPAAA